MQDTWTWNGSTHDWTQKSPSGQLPPKRESEGLTFDGASGHVLLFGGLGACVQGGGITQCGDTWVWLGGTQNKWNQCKPATQCSTSPTARSSPAMVYHSGRGATIMFGGNTSMGLNPETWAWDGSTWGSGPLDVSGPAARTGHRVAYDPVKGAVLLFGGCTGGCGSSDEVPGTVTNDSWSLDGGNWTNQVPDPTKAAPSARCCVGMVYFATGTPEIAIFGGANGTFPNGMNDMWVWTWGTQGNPPYWTCISPQSTCHSA